MKTIFEYRKGVLFIRLFGVLTKETSNDFELEINNIIKENGLTNVVLNIEKISNIDQKGIHLLYYIYELSRKNNGKSLICNIPNENIRRKLKRKRLLNYVKEIDNELRAFELIKI